MTANNRRESGKDAKGLGAVGSVAGTRGEWSASTGRNGDAVASSARRLLIAREAAAMLRISDRRLWTMTNAGEVPHVRLGRRVLYPLDQLGSWIDAQIRGGGDTLNRAS